MMITSRYCSVELTYYDGIFNHATIYICNEIWRAGQKEYWQPHVSYKKATKALWRLAKASGQFPETQINMYDPKICTRLIIWYREF